MLMIVAGEVGVGREDIKYLDRMKNPLTLISFKTSNKDLSVSHVN